MEDTDDSDDSLLEDGADEDIGDDDEMENAGVPPLPEGMKKEIIIKGLPSPNWKKLKAGDDVTVHYVGTLQSDSSEFDSSRSRGQPFVFTLGQGIMVKGWDIAIETMQQGEVAKFTISPEFAYGDSGLCPKIPAKATLVFEIELIGWVSKFDLFRDGGVVKARLKEGKGWKDPEDGEEVVISLKAFDQKGAIIEERPSFEYIIGSKMLGPLATVVNKALVSMRAGEEATLTCTKDYAYGDEKPEGAIIDLKLEQIYETKDVSHAKDKSLMKKQIKEGEGYDLPKDSSKVTLKVEAASDGIVPLPGFKADTLKFTSGNGEVCDALECAVCKMKKKERAVLTIMIPAVGAEEQLGLKDVNVEKVVLTLELLDFENSKDPRKMSEEEKMVFGTARKDVGAGLFKQGRYYMALDRYKQVNDMFSYVGNFTEDNKRKVKEIKKACALNSAACLLKVNDYAEAKKSCNSVLKEDPDNVKGRFRRAQADFGLGNFLECMSDLKRVMEIDPNNKEARVLYKDALASQRKEEKKSWGGLAKMSSGIEKLNDPKDDPKDESKEPRDRQKENKVPVGDSTS